MTPQLSVIIPVWNGALYLDASIQSVLQQGFPDIEIIVVDDGSTDGSAELVSRMGKGITCISQQNQGPAAARNTGLQSSSGEFVAFIDSDDIWRKGRLSRQLAYLHDHPAIDIVQGQIQYMRQFEVEWLPYDAPFYAMSLSTALFRRELFDQVGVFDISMRYCEDVDWFFRAQQIGIAMHRQSGVTLYYRRHKDNLTNRNDLVKYYTLRCIRKYNQSRQILKL